MKKYLLLLFFLSCLGFTYGQSNGDFNVIETDCSYFDSSITNGCDQCFQGLDPLREGDAITRNTIYDEFVNNDDEKYFLFLRDDYAGFYVYDWEVLQPDHTDRWISDDLVEFSGDLTWSNPEEDGWYHGWFTYFEPDSTTRIYDIKEDKGIVLDSVDSNIDISSPAFRFDFNIRYRYFEDGLAIDSSLSEPEDHKECLFVYAEPEDEPELSCDSLNFTQTDDHGFEYDFTCMTTSANALEIRIFDDENPNVENDDPVHTINLDNPTSSNSQEEWTGEVDFATLGFDSGEYYAAAFAIGPDGNSEMLTSGACQTGIGVGPEDLSCDSLSPRNTTVQEGDTLDFTCTGTNADEYRMYVDGDLIDTNTTGSFSHRFDDEGEYETRCEVTNPFEGWETSNACQGNVTVDEDNGNGGGGVPVRCGPAEGNYNDSHTDWHGDFCAPSGASPLGNIPNFNDWKADGFPRIEWLCQRPGAVRLVRCVAGGDEDDPDTPDTPEIFVEPAQCEWIDPPSIQVGEYLPIWWALENSDMYGGTCNSNNVGTIRNDAQCRLKIENKDGSVYDDLIDCIGRDGNFDRNLLSGFRGGSLGEDNSHGSTAMILDEGMVNGVFGEYKVSIKVENYQVCDGSDWRNVNLSNRTCQYNFPVTQPYLMQKGATLSSNDNTFENFYQINGDNVDVDVDNVSSSQNFNPSSVGSILNDFVEDYENRAVQSVSYGPLAGMGCKKVPAEEVYVCEDDITISSSISSDPYTLIVKDGDLTIDGDLLGNGMYVVTDGNIEFTANNYNSRQVVEGIFLTNGNFEQDQLINNNLSNPWIKDGRLQVKGILRGGGIENLINHRRSYIGDWFSGGGPGPDDIYDGASLLVESNPSIWDNLPPGARSMLDDLNIQRR